MNLNYKKTTGDRIFDFFIYFFVILIILVTLYPLIYVFSMAISDPVAAARGEVYFLPKGIDFTAISKVLSDTTIWTYYYNTLWYTVVGTLTGIATTCLAAYPLARREFRYKAAFLAIMTPTMFFGGGLIPSYIVTAKFLHLYDTRWAIILPGLTSCWYIVTARTYFQTIPEEIIESARLDGASEFCIFGQLIVPLSKPILGVLALYYAVGHWNSYFSAMIYLSKRELQPLALYIRSVVIQNSLESIAGGQTVGRMTASQILSSLQLKYAVIVVSVVPMLLIYPLISGNLEKGLLIGSVKA